MKILVSACLLGTDCKYSGGNNRCPALLKALTGHTVIPVCPEVMGGLPTPRVPAEIVNGIVTNANGENVDRQFRLGSAKALALALEQGVDLAVLQPRSPSCGSREVYDGSFTGSRIPGKGIFAASLADAGIPVLEPGDIGAEGFENAPQWLYSEALIRENYRKLTRRLIEKKLTITAMESATAGTIASLITDTEGSSAVLRGAFVTYSNEVKTAQGVPAEIINTYTVYSAQTAAAMARACAERLHADIGIGVTGTTGNTDPDNPENSVPGRIWYALHIAGQTRTFEISLPSLPDRRAYKLAAAGHVVQSLLALL